MFIYSFIERGTYGGVRWVFTLENYQRLFDGLYLGILWRSVSTALVCTAVCLLLGYPFAYYLARYRPKHRSILLLLVVVPFWTNFLIRTYAWILILRTEGLMNSPLWGPFFPNWNPIRTAKHAVSGADRTRLRLSTLHDTPVVCGTGTIRYVAAGSSARLRRIATPCILAYNRSLESARYSCGINAGFLFRRWVRS